MAVDYFKRLREGGEADRAWVRGVHPSHPFFSHEAIHSMHLEGIYIWDSVQLNHPYGTFSKFPEQAKEK